MTPSHRVDGPRAAPVLVLSSSLGTSMEMWAPQLPALAARFRVVRYEHRGHGGTAPPAPGPYTIADLGGDLVELLDHLGVERASLCGLSLGGMVGLWVAVHHPERVERLVLACTAAELGPPEAWAERAAVVRAQSPSVLQDVLVARWFVEPRPQLVAGMLDATDREGYAGCCEAIGAMDQRADLHRVTAPTLVIAGADDPVTPPARALELQAGIGGAALAVLPHAAHLANLDQPGAFTDAVVDHLAGRPAVRGEAVRRRVLGDAHVDRSAASTSAAAATFGDFITRIAWGEVWTRPTLDLRTRSCLTVALLAGLGRLEELELHVAGARRNGLTDEEIAEVIIHTAVYAGVPAANAALRVARRVLESDG
ncbi:MAG: bifunctional 3-oxoadipate enol-lactonase/4-carboxymuconolactone decarboxylase PcaDC [Acidimicrobiales bacterium]